MNKITKLVTHRGSRALGRRSHVRGRAEGAFPGEIVGGETDVPKSPIFQTRPY